MHRFCSLIAIFFLFDNLSAQDIPTTLRIRNQKNEPVPYATITVVNRADSSKVSEKVADSTGVAKFGLEKGQYLVRISTVNYLPLEKGITISTRSTNFTIPLEPLPKTLRSVVVTAQKPLMRQEDDKTIVEPENLAAISTNGYEVIEKTPGLFVDQDGNIYISSLSPATVQINGRDMKMSAADMASLLKSLPPTAITRIEIVRTPSAKNDATSSGGVVNIVLKKGVKLGMTGSMSAGMQQGNYGNQFAGFSLNNSDGKKSSSLNLNLNRRNNYEKILTDRIFAPDSMLSQHAITTYPATSFFGSYSYTVPLNPKWDIDFGTSASYNDYNNHTENNSRIRKISTGQLVSNNLNRVNNHGSSFNYRVGVEGTRKIDSMGSEWVTDLFYNYTKNSSDQDFSSDYFFPIDTVTRGDGHYRNYRNYFTVKSDLKLKMRIRFTLEAGVKSSILGFNNAADYFKQANGNREKDPGRTNRFQYKEYIHSGYLQGSKTLAKDLIIKAGLRLENTNMNGNQLIPADTNFSIHRTDLFPYIYISKKVMSIANYELRAYLVYRRTINRPVYEQLNPFSRYIDEYLSEKGNPSLRPQFTTNYEANVSVDERPLLAIGINKTKDIFTNVIYQADSSQRQAFRTYDNLGTNKEWYMRALGAIPPGKKYFFVLGVQYNHNFYQGFYENKPLSYKKGTWTFFTFHNLKLDKRSQFTLNGFMRLKGQQQFYELSTFGQLNASINRQFLQQKLTITASVNDIFSTNKNDFSIAQGSIKATGTRSADSRRFGLNFRYNFGIRKKEDVQMPEMDVNSH